MFRASISEAGSRGKSLSKENLPVVNHVVGLLLRVDVPIGVPRHGDTPVIEPGVDGPDLVAIDSRWSLSISIIRTGGLTHPGRPRGVEFRFIRLRLLWVEHVHIHLTPVPSPCQEETPGPTGRRLVAITVKT